MRLAHRLMMCGLGGALGPSVGVLYVGGTSSSISSALPAPTSYTCDIPSGVEPGDIVVVLVTGSYYSGINILSSGFTEEIRLFADDNCDTYLVVAWKIMGSTPDTEIQLWGSGSSWMNADGSCIVMAFRNVSATAPIETINSVTGINSSAVNPPAITPTTPGAMIIAVGATTLSTATWGSQYTNPAAADAFENIIKLNSPGYSFPCPSAMAAKGWEAGPVDPAVWTGTSTDTSCSWAAATLALKPA